MRPSCIALLLLAAVAGERHELRTTRLRKRRSRPSGRDTSLAALHSYYHSTEGISKRLHELSAKCPGMTLQTLDATAKSGDNRSIEVVTIRALGTSPANRHFLLFGEHARELISPESGLHLVESLCGGHGMKDRANEILQHSEFQVVVNANPGSRPQVEKGDYCLRWNPNGVDLNRNWDEKWGGADLNRTWGGVGLHPGSAPFSEAETRIFRNLTEGYKPTSFVTVHSGTKGMYMPWAYDTEHLASRNRQQMMQMLRKLDKTHCHCPFGAAGKEVGYSCPGTSIDWVFDKLKTPYSFAFEIYTSHDEDASLKRRWDLAMKDGGDLIQTHGHLGHEHFRHVFERHPSSFVQLRSQARYMEQGMSADQCFDLFNPGSEEDFNKIRDNWTGAYLDLAELVDKQMKADAAAASI